MAYSDVYTLCPFLIRRDGNIFRCKGPVHGTNVNWIWPDENAAKEQERIFCHKHYTRCELYRCNRQNLYFDEDDE